MRSRRVLEALALTASVGTTAARAQDTEPAAHLLGYVQVRETYRADNLTATLNRARAGLEGSLTHGFTYRLLVEYEAGGSGTTPAGVSLRDAFVRWAAGRVNLTGGQFKTPFTREFITSITEIETADRAAVVDSLAPKRDIGIMGGYDGGRYGIQVGVFNGEGQNRIANLDSTNLIVARATGRPLAPLELGANLARYGADSARYGIDGRLDYRGATIQAEFIWQDRPGDAPNDRGWYALAAYRVRPWVQLVLKQERFERPALGADRLDLATTGGVNVWFAGKRIRLLANYVSRRLGRPGVRAGTLIAQAQVRF